MGCIGLYLRGSVAQGTDVPGISDLDIFGLVFNKGIRWRMASWVNELETAIHSRVDFPVEVECMLASYEKSFALKRPFLARIIKTQSLCLWGNDIGPQLPEVKPGKEMRMDSRWYAEDFLEFQKAIDEENSISSGIFRTFMKITLRVGFELVMERENEYTRDLGLCYLTFSKYYPQKKRHMYQALQWFLNPVSDKAVLGLWAEEMARWLVEEVANYDG